MSKGVDKSRNYNKKNYLPSIRTNESLLKGNNKWSYSGAKLHKGRDSRSFMTLQRHNFDITPHNKRFYSPPGNTKLSYNNYRNDFVIVHSEI